MNPISSWWLKKRQSTILPWISHSVVVDVGARTEKVTADAIGLDLQRTSDIQADGCHLPFRDHSITTLVAAEFVEHLDYGQLEDFFKEAQRTSQHIVISTPNCDSISWQVVWFLWTHFGGRVWHSKHIAQYCGIFLLSFFERHQLTVTHSKVTRWSLFYHLTVG